jgi:hypothetical protein
MSCSALSRSFLISFNLGRVFILYLYLANTNTKHHSRQLNNFFQASRLALRREDIVALLACGLGIWATIGQPCSWRLAAS